MKIIVTCPDCGLSYLSEDRIGLKKSMRLYGNNYYSESRHNTYHVIIANDNIFEGL